MTHLFYSHGYKLVVVDASTNEVVENIKKEDLSFAIAKIEYFPKSDRLIFVVNQNHKDRHGMAWTFLKRSCFDSNPSNFFLEKM
jgi:hypothetical protein